MTGKLLSALFQAITLIPEFINIFSGIVEVTFAVAYYFPNTKNLQLWASCSDAHPLLYLPIS